MAISIGGYTPESVTDIQTSRTRNDSLGDATVTMVASQQNRANISPGDDVQIGRGGQTFRGYVVGRRPIEDSPSLMRVVCLEDRLELKHSDLQQVFYDVTSSEAVTQAIQQRAQPLGEHLVHTGDSLTDWDLVAPVAQLYGGERAGLYDWGTDLLFLGARRGYSGTIAATYTDVTTDAIVDGLYSLATRLVVPDAADVWDVEIELLTPNGTTYRWSPTVGQGFETLQLNAEDASPTGQLTEPGTLQYRFSPGATLANNRGIFIDHAVTKRYRLQSRQTTLLTAGVEATDRTIRRRPGGTVGEFITELATEDQFDWYVDDGTVFYGPGSGGVDVAIEQGTTPVVDVSVDRDYESIRNIVTVQGDGVQETVRDQASIAFYGPTSRPEPIVDPSIKTSDEAQARAEGYLADHAWDDSVAEFTVADTAFGALTPTDRLPVTWPRRGLDGVYDVDSVAVDTGELVAVGIIASSG